MPLYESTFVVRQDISSQEVENLAQKFSQIIVDNGGSVVKTEFWGLRNLAYTIKKNRKGHYVMLAIDAPSPAVKEMERNLGLNDDILRNVTVSVKEIEKGPSFMANNRGDQDSSRESFRGGNNNRSASEDAENTDAAVA